MAIEDMQVKLVKESMVMLNGVAVRHDLGNDWKWTLGMLNYHLPLFYDRAKWIDDKSIITDMVEVELIKLLDCYLDYCAENGYDHQAIRTQIINSGLRGADYGMETGGEPSIDQDS